MYQNPANMVPNYSTAPPAASNRVGQFTTGISAGALPQATLNHASQTMLAPAAMSAGQVPGALGQQFGQLMGQQQNQGNTELLRQAAPMQAQLQLGSQIANANAGLQNMGLLSRLDQDRFAQGQLGRNLMWQLLGQYGGF